MDRDHEDGPRKMLRGESEFEADDRFPSYKLDLTFFTLRDLCPAMVRQGSRKSFELFMYESTAPEYRIDGHGQQWSVYGCLPSEFKALPLDAAVICMIRFAPNS